MANVLETHETRVDVIAGDLARFAAHHGRSLDDGDAHALAHQFAELQFGGVTPASTSTALNVALGQERADPDFLAILRGALSSMSTSMHVARLGPTVDDGVMSLGLGVYAIVDASPNDDKKNVVALVDAILTGHPNILQLRCKGLSPTAVVDLSRTVAAKCRIARVPFIVNDFVDVALQVEADGVHLGLDDGSPRDARATLGPGATIGGSTHSDAEAEVAANDGALNYIAFGPVFLSSTKTGHADVQGLAALKRAGRIARDAMRPLVAIGGINDSLRAFSAAAHGAQLVACISALSSSSDPGFACFRFRVAVNCGAACARE